MRPNLFVRWYRRLSVKKRDSQCPTVIEFMRAAGWQQEGLSGFWFHPQYAICLRLPQAVYLECRRQHRRAVRVTWWIHWAVGTLLANILGHFFWPLIRDLCS